MTPTPTSGAADLPEALRSIQRFEVVDCIDDNHVPAVIPKPHGPWVRYEDHIAALAAVQATAAQAGVQDDLITLRKPTTSAELLWLLKLAHLVISDVDKTLEETFAPAQPAAEASRFGSPELQAMIIARCVEKDRADSVPAVSDLPPLPAPDLRDVGTKPQEIKEFLKGYATEYARAAIAARAPASEQPAAQQLHGAAYAALPDEGEPWRGHKFKEVQRGCWRCDCGKTIKEVTSDQSTPASGGNYPVMPKRYTVDDDGEELFTAEKMRAFADATHTLRASHGEAPAQTADSQLLQFYGVTTDAELIAAQAAHIEKLQAKLTKTPSFAPQRVREG